MLFRKNLGRRHEGGLEAGIYGEQHGGEGNEGFPRAYVSVQEAVHGPFGSHVVLNFSDGPQLRRCEWEREALMQAVEKTGGGGMAEAGFSLLLGAALGDAELHAEELCEDKMGAGFS